MARFEDLAELPNETARMNAIRERIALKLYEWAKEEFGEDYAVYVPKEIYITDGAIKIPKLTVVADVGDVPDKAGFTVGACVEISVKSKKWNTVERKDGRTQYGVTLDDYKEGV